MFILMIISLCSSKKSGKIKTAYKMDYLNMNCDVDFDFAGPTVHGAAVLGYGQLTFFLSISVLTIKFLNFRIPENFAVIHPEIDTTGPNLRVLHQKDVNGKANSVDPDSNSSLIWVCTVCTDLSVGKLRVIAVIKGYHIGWF